MATKKKFLVYRVLNNFERCPQYEEAVNMVKTLEEAQHELYLSKPESWNADGETIYLVVPAVVATPDPKPNLNAPFGIFNQ